jgi:glucokinase
MRHKRLPQMNAEEGACIRAVRRVYAEQAGIPFESAPEPREISEIAAGALPGNKAAAIEAYQRLGEVVGDALGNALTLIDGLVVIGGGVSKAYPHFLPAVVNELNSHYTNPQGKQIRRLTQVAFNLEDPAQLASFLQGHTREVLVPGSGRKVCHDPLPRIGVGISGLGTSEAVAIGAYAYALKRLEKI